MNRRGRRETKQKGSSGGGYWLVAGVFLFLVVIGLGCYFVYSWRSQGVWRNQGRLSGVWLSSGKDHALRVFSFHPDDGLVMITLPPDAEVQVSRGYGAYQVKSLWRLADQENDFRLITQTMSMFMGTGIQYWIEGKAPKCDLEEFSCIRDVSRMWWGQDVKTNLPFWDRILLWYELRKLSGNEYRYLELDETSWAGTKLAADGKEYVTFDQDFVDARIGTWFLDRNILEESMAISLVNTTDVGGLARRFGRIVSGMGGRVVQLRDAKVDLENCLMRVNESAVDSLTVRRLRDLLGCDVDTISDDAIDIEILLGRMQAEWLDADRAR